MAKPRITLYLDIVSPFAYMAFYMLRHSPIFSTCEITYVPILLGGLMNSCNNRPPIEIKNKDKWIGIERHRWATQFKIPISKTSPPGFPPRTLDTQRALCALQISHPQLLPQAFDALYQAFWVEANGGIGQVNVFGKVLEQKLGKDVAGEVVKRIGEKEVKSRLIENTNQAFERGAFGLPWFWCRNRKGDEEGFWGFDHLGQVARFLEVDGAEERLRPLL